ncbi:MAG TPA: glyoxalase, partial [Porticoccaceae bacterium]|nr:glyoxalase [Porticoccaceae bacterium]
RKGEQATLFVSDPSGNHLEFKAFRNIDMLFDKDLDNY